MITLFEETTAPTSSDPKSVGKIESLISRSRDIIETSRLVSSHAAEANMPYRNR